MEHLDLDLPDGSFTAILGPSGCGKTTTLRMLAGLEVPTTGTVTVGERLFSSAADGIFVPPNDRHLGLVFQNYALWPHLSAARNVEFGLAVKKVGRVERRRRIGDVLDLLRVAHLADRLPAQLSGGEQQRVAIARALAPNPSLVLFDEPLSNLDAQLRLELSSELHRLHRELGMTAVLVTHDQAEAMAVATVLVVMRDGAVEQVGSPVEVYRAPATTHVAKFLGSPPMNLHPADGPLSSLRDAIAQGQGLEPGMADVVGVRPEHVLLDDARPGWRQRARARSVLSTGASALVHLVLDGGAELSAVVRGESDLEPDRVVEVTVEADRGHLFDREGRRLRPRGVPSALPTSPELFEEVLPWSR